MPSARVYLAGPLFTQAEWLWNEHIATRLTQRSLEVLVPQRRAEPMLMGKEPFNPGLLFEENLRQIENADAIVAILDGADPDSGTSWECGYAFKLGTPVIGVRSDIRAGGDDPATAINLMLSIGCAEFVRVPFEIRSDIAWVADRIVEAVRHALESKSRRA